MRFNPLGLVNLNRDRALSEVTRREVHIDTDGSARGSVSLGLIEHLVDL